MSRILFIHNGLARFVQIDRDLLAEDHDVTEIYTPAPKQIRPFDLWRLVKAHDLVYCWFASWHALLPLLFARQQRKPSILVVGGYDTANVPAADYGSQRGGFRRIVARTSIVNATQIITFSQSARKEAIANAKADPQKTTMIYLGIEPKEMVGPDVRGQNVLTVGAVWRGNLLRKGLLPFVHAAAFLPDVKFIHVGKWLDDSINDLRRIAGPNVEFRGFIPDQQLDDLYARSAVYVQASLHEGFGMSVAEAMLVGCIPVVTHNGSLPEVVGDTGVYCASTDPREIAAAIKRALTLNGPARMKARDRILSHFSIEQRKESLLEVVEQVLHGK